MYLPLSKSIGDSKLQGAYVFSQGTKCKKVVNINWYCLYLKEAERLSACT